VNPKRRRARGLFLTGLAVLLLALFVCRGQALSGAGRFLDVSNPPARSDYVMVLGGGSDVRPFVAAAVYRAGLATTVLVPRVATSPWSAAEGHPPEGEIIRKVLRARGVPQEVILTLEGECVNTQDEAAALARFLANRPGRTVSVVTSAYHTRRARAIFRAAVGEGAGRLSFVGAPTDGYDADTWWLSEDGFTAYLREYGKLFAYTFGR
jgi:uncharacterized SAM-binding protein YcdF (DUF218 family)